MPPDMSADLHAQGMLSTKEAPYVYDRNGVVIANLQYWIKDGGPVF